MNMTQKFEQKLIELGFEFEKVERSVDDNCNMVFPDDEPWIEYFVYKSLTIDFDYCVSFAYCPGINEFVLYIDSHPGYISQEQCGIEVWVDEYGESCEFTDENISPYTLRNVEELCIDYDS